MPFASFPARRPPAIRSFSPRTFLSTGTCVIQPLPLPGTLPERSHRVRARQNPARLPGFLQSRVRAAPEKNPSPWRRSRTGRFAVNTGQLADAKPHPGGPAAGYRYSSFSTASRTEAANTHFMHPAIPAETQQILGNWSPASKSTIRVEPNAVRIVTNPALLSPTPPPPTTPIIAASFPRG